MSPPMMMVMMTMIMTRKQARLLIALAVVSQVCLGTDSGPSMVCQDRYGVLPVQSYNYRSCTLCYEYLFKGRKELASGRMYDTLFSKNATHGTVWKPIAPDIENDTVVDIICSTLDEAECSQWRLCCTSALKCCERQLLLPREETQEGHCKRTWDGYSCWDDTAAGKTVSVTCPKYVGQLISDRWALKHCTENGTWFQKGGHEWTDYTPCINKESYIIGCYISLGCSSASLILLLPAIVIFLVFRDLRNQLRVRLHIQFFMSLALAGVFNILWVMLVRYDVLTRDSNTAILHTNPVWCRLLSFMKIYLTATNYFWMFGEGFFLHRLITNAFEPPETLLPIYLLGWAVPATPTLAYAIFRVVFNDESCWAISLPGYQWIIYIPNFFCVLMNLIFLCNILRILVFQLHAHPHEPSSFRRGLKAAFMLIPLFGLHSVGTIYRPHPDAPGAKEYEYVTFMITNLQGAFVALIYCFFNGEVVSHMRKLCPTRTGRDVRFASANFTQVTLCEGRSPTNSIKSRGSPPRSNGSLRTENKDQYEMSAVAGDQKKDIQSAAQMTGTQENTDNSTIPNNKQGYAPIPTIVMTDA